MGTTIAMIASLVLSILGASADPIVRKIRSKQNVTIDDARLLINSALSMAQNLGQDKLDKISEGLMNLSVIQKTPALSDAINKAYKRLINERTELKSDINRLESDSLKSQVKLDQAEDYPIFGRKKKIKEAVKEANNYVQEAEKFEKRL